MDLVFEDIGNGKLGGGFDDGADPEDLIVHQNPAVDASHFNAGDFGVFEETDNGGVASGFRV